MEEQQEGLLHAQQRHAQDLALLLDGMQQQGRQATATPEQQACQQLDAGSAETAAAAAGGKGHPDVPAAAATRLVSHTDGGSTPSLLGAARAGGCLASAAVPAYNSLSEPGHMQLAQQAGQTPGSATRLGAAKPHGQPRLHKEDPMHEMLPLELPEEQDVHAPDLCCLDEELHVAAGIAIGVPCLPGMGSGSAPLLPAASRGADKGPTDEQPPPAAEVTADLVALQQLVQSTMHAVEQRLLAVEQRQQQQGEDGALAGQLGTATGGTLEARVEVLEGGAAEQQQLLQDALASLQELQQQTQSIAAEQQQQLQLSGALGSSSRGSLLSQPSSLADRCALAPYCMA